MSGTYTNPYRSMIDSLQPSAQTRQILKVASMNLNDIKPSVLPSELLKPTYMGLGAIKQSMLPTKLLKPTYMELGAIKQSMLPTELLKPTYMGLGAIKQSMFPPELLKPTYMGLGAIKQSMLPTKTFKAASMALNPSLTKLLGTDQITKLATTELGNSMSPYIKKAFDINSIFDSAPSISEAIKLNVKAASAWNSISKTMNIESFSTIMSNNLNYNTFNTESVSYQCNDQTSNLKSDEAIPEDNDWQPRQSASDDDISSKNLGDENIELMEYLNNEAIHMFNNGFSLPVIASILISWALTFTNVLTKVKDSTDAYIWLGHILIDIYVVLKLLG